MRAQRKAHPYPVKRWSARGMIDGGLAVERLRGGRITQQPAERICRMGVQELPLPPTIFLDGNGRSGGRG